MDEVLERRQRCWRLVAGTAVVIGVPMALLAGAPVEGIGLAATVAMVAAIAAAAHVHESRPRPQLPGIVAAAAVVGGVTTLGTWGVVALGGPVGAGVIAVQALLVARCEVTVLLDRRLFGANGDVRTLSSEALVERWRASDGTLRRTRSPQRAALVVAYRQRCLDEMLRRGRSRAG